MPFVGGKPPATGGGSRPAYTSSVLINESGNVVGGVTCGAANTYGSWVNIGTTAFAVDSFFLQIAFGAGRGAMVDISYGASGGANVVATGVCFTLLTNTSASTYVPCRIPSGVTVWCRIASPTASTTFTVGLTAVGPQSTFSFTSCEITTSGSAINSQGAVVNVDNVGTWVAIGSPTATAYAGFMVYTGGNGDTARTVAQIITRLATGSAGSQVEFFETYTQSGTGTVTGNTLGPFYASIPSGTQLWARADASTATGDTANVAFLGLIP